MTPVPPSSFHVRDEFTSRGGNACPYKADDLDGRTQVLEPEEGERCLPCCNVTVSLLGSFEDEASFSFTPEEGNHVAKWDVQNEILVTLGVRPQHSLITNEHENLSFARGDSLPARSRGEFRFP